jgi:hypothetical protein
MNPKKSIRLFFFLLAAAVLTALIPLAVLADSQTATGTIGSVGDSSFMLRTDVGQTLQFVLDGNTVVNGELKAGAKATVTYRVEDGKNIAERVEVQS